MPTGYHDDSNNPRYNFVPHLAAGDTQRGLPIVGKLVYRTDNDGLEVCTSTSPDPGENGGGTWSSVSGPAWDASVVSMTGSGQPTWGTSDFSNRRWCVIGDYVHATYYAKFSSGFNSGSGGNWYNFVLPVTPNYYSFGVGPGLIYNPSDGYRVVTAIMNQGITGAGYVNLFGDTYAVAANAPFGAWAEGALIYFSITYRAA